MPPGGEAQPDPRTRGRWRWARRAIACLFIGAAVNVLVAWGCALPSESGFIRSGASRAILDRWPEPVPGDWPSAPDRASLYFGTGTKLSVISGTFFRKDRSDITTLCYVRDSGWPIYSLRQTGYDSFFVIGSLGFDKDAERNRQLTDSIRADVDPDQHAQLLKLPMEHWWVRGFSSVVLRRTPASRGNYSFTSEKGVVYLPTRPLTYGVIVNTLAYGSVCAVFWVVVHGTRRRIKSRRIRMGSCSNCNYSLSGLPESCTACPECGTPRVKPSA